MLVRLGEWKLVVMHLVFLSLSLFPISSSVGELSNEAITLLSSHLSIPSYGSLKNWDSIGIHLGIPDHEVMVSILTLRAS